MNLLEYIDWCKKNDTTKIVNIKSSETCSKKEILDYAEFLNKTQRKIMNSGQFISDTDIMLKCNNCKFNKEMSKGPLTQGGTLTYTITCKKEMICFNTKWNSHISDLPCYG
jgi:hypothetical protein